MAPEAKQDPQDLREKKANLVLKDLLATQDPQEKKAIKVLQENMASLVKRETE